MTPRLSVALRVGPARFSDGSHFEGEDDASLEEAYWSHREWLLDPKRNRPGERPWSFWAFEVTDESMLDASREERLAFLRQHDLLLPGEPAALTC